MGENTNEQNIKEMEELSQQIQSLYAQNKLAERNKLVERWRELRKNTDYGYREGQQVEYLRYKRKWEQASIRKIYDNWQIEIGNRIIPVEFIRKITD